MGRNNLKGIILAASAMVLVMLGLTFLVCRYAMMSEKHARYVGIMNVASEKVAKSIRGMEINAKNVFDEVQKHMDSPEAVVAALKSKTSLNPDIVGYFAAFEQDFFPRRRDGTSLISRRQMTARSTW